MIICVPSDTDHATQPKAQAVLYSAVWEGKVKALIVQSCDVFFSKALKCSEEDTAYRFFN